MPDTILVINTGSSSIKFELFELGAQNGLTRIIRGRCEGIGIRPHLVASDAAGAKILDESFPATEVDDHAKAISRIQQGLRARLGPVSPAAVGHRVVHGGTRYSGPVAVDDSTIAYLDQLVPLAPLHQPYNLGPIKALRARAPELLQVACFDTAFHRAHAEVAERFAVPDALYQEGVRRYGFHGLSYEYIASRLPDVAPKIADGRVVVAHLGNGASMCAMVRRRSVESTMGFTALDGLPMGTRPGQLDAGVVLYLLAEKQMDARAIEHFLYNECGLKGLSGISSDVRELLASSDSRAAFALDFFAYRAGLLAASLVAAMGGIDGFVFTAGIGENAPTVRQRIVERMAWLGMELDPAANARNRPRISRDGSAVDCYVIPTDEELMIGRHTLDLLRSRVPLELAEGRS